MSGHDTSSKRLISLTGGNLRNQHLYITGHHDFFPAECFGASSAQKGTGQPLTLIVDGLLEPVQADIARSAGNRNPRGFFRKRAWMPMLFCFSDLAEPRVPLDDGDNAP